MKTTDAVFAEPGHPQFAPFALMEQCQCSGCQGLWEKFGYAPGCQQVTGNIEEDPKPKAREYYFQKRRLQDIIHYPNGTWYSLPGACPSKACWDKTSACRQQEPG